MHKDKCGLSQMYLWYGQRLLSCIDRRAGVWCGVVVRVGPGLPECMAAAIVSSLLSSIASTLPRQASKVCLACLLALPACLPASARRACPGPCSRLSMRTTGYLRQATALTVGSTSASTCTHARPSASLGSLQPSPGPHKPITHPILTSTPPA